MVNKSADPGRISIDQLQDEARAWVRLLASNEVKPWDAQGFKRWLRTSPAHPEAFNEARRLWQLMRPAAADLLRGNPAIAASHQRALRGSVPERRAFLGMALGATAAAAVTVAVSPLGLWPTPAEWGADYRTATGEQRTLAVAANVNVMLNTQTAIRRRTDHGETTGLELLKGEAVIDVRGTAAPFAILAGAGRSLAGSGQMEVRYLDGKVCVTCIDGTARVEHPAGVRMLQARQQAVYDAQGISGIAAVDAGDASAWRNGELIFKQARLAEVIDEINRYRSGRVMLMNDAVRDSKVSGRFAIAALDTALWQLEHTYQLKAQPLPGGLLILS